MIRTVDTWMKMSSAGGQCGGWEEATERERGAGMQSRAADSVVPCWLCARAHSAEESEASTARRDGEGAGGGVCVSHRGALRALPTLAQPRLPPPQTAALSATRMLHPASVSATAKTCPLMCCSGRTGINGWHRQTQLCHFTDTFRGAAAGGGRRMRI